MWQNLFSGALAGVVALGALAPSAQAQDWFNPDVFDERSNRSYFSASGGAAWIDELSSDDLAGLGFANEVEFDTGHTAHLALGTYVERLRFETELGYIAADIDRFTVNGADLGIDGDVRAITGMINAYYDIPIHRVVHGYIGGGLGAAYVELDAAATLGPGVTISDDEETVLAYQAMAGLGFRLSDTVTLTTGYRFWTTDDPEFDAGEFDAPEVHMAEIGLRFDF